MNNSIDEDKVRRLRTEVAKCTGLPDMPEDYQEYFATHSENGSCLYCGERHTFTWGLVHGTGYCAKCRWPARLYHFFADSREPHGERRVIRLLQIHPSMLILSGEGESLD